MRTPTFIESEPIWDFFDEELKDRKPVLVPYRDPVAGTLRNFWVIDGHLVPKPLGLGGQLLATPPIEEKQRSARGWRVRDLSDLESRLEDAGEMGVDVQVIYPTIFIMYLTDDTALEVALARSYNRFMADVWFPYASDQRLRHTILRRTTPPATSHPR